GPCHDRHLEQPGGRDPPAMLVVSDVVVSECALSDDGGMLAAAPWDQPVRLYDTATGHPRPLAGGGGSSFCVVVAPGGATVAAIGLGGWLHEWDAASGRLRVTVELGIGRTEFRFTGDNRRLIVCGRFGFRVMRRDGDGWVGGGLARPAAADHLAVA